MQYSTYFLLGPHVFAGQVGYNPLKLEDTVMVVLFSWFMNSFKEHT
ncbi:MAG TPA: hypothetical protein VNV85_07325 [Puia sp.]|nr:hypothetical protein [Puia sp.]